MCGLDQEKLPLVPGRSGPELGASLFQLENFLAKNLEFAESYRAHKATTFKDDPQLIDLQVHPELAPYKSLNADRLRIAGKENGKNCRFH